MSGVARRRGGRDAGQGRARSSARCSGAFQSALTAAWACTGMVLATAVLANAKAWLRACVYHSIPYAV